MKAMVIDEFGGANQLHAAEVPTPVAGSGEVLIKLAATSVNPVDWKIREGHLAKALPHHFPLILGWDAAGTIAAIGPGVADFRPGDKVYAYARKPEVQWGTYADYIALDAQAVALAPRGLSLQAAATLPLVGLTSWQVLFDAAKLDAGQWVLIHAGAGGIGSLAIQLAKAKKARVVTTARAENHAYVKELGADIVIDYTAEPFAAAVRRAVPEGVDVVFDTMGGQTQAESWGLLKAGGILVSIVDPPDEAKAAAMGLRSGYVFVSPNGQQLRELAALIETGQVKPPAFEVLPLAEATMAQERSQTHHVRGKIVLEIG
ncbi:MAG TPA: NADP-dependent oxidoreductase [Telmatospirillum sp.]|nr:NADP-dependent oxidoreductase [Telmatospirillum sp.]